MTGRSRQSVCWQNITRNCSLLNLLLYFIPNVREKVLNINNGCRPMFHHLMLVIKLQCALMAVMLTILLFYSCPKIYEISASILCTVHKTRKSTKWEKLNIHILEHENV